MSTRRVSVAVAGLLAIATVATGCGSSSSSASAPATPSTTDPMVVRVHAEDGILGSTSDADLVQDTADIAAGLPTDAPERVHGMDGAVSQHLTGTGGDDAVRVVGHFPDAASAAAVVASFRTTHAPDGAAITVFEVPGIPGAVGSSQHNRSGGRSLNVAFSVGDYEYVLGAATSQGKPTQQELVNAAQAWYAKVKDLS